MFGVTVEGLLAFLIQWGIWLIVPLLIDVISTVRSFTSVFKKNGVDDGFELKFFPLVTIIIPVYNSGATLMKCLKSLYHQTYPVECMEIICVNNGSTDNSFDVFQEFQSKYSDVIVSWNSTDRPNKSVALNAGVYMGTGSYVLNIDSDTWLDKNTIMNVAKAFEKDKNLVAATAYIRVDKSIKRGKFKFIDIINYCELLEYLLAFNVGRRYQHLKNVLFTLSGAFSAFRRDAIIESFMYQERTVSEDTDLTFQIKRNMKKNKGAYVGCILDAIAYVEPILSLESLYAQRLRWQRGQLEVLAAHNVVGNSIIKDASNFVGRMFISDHTLALIRMIWTFLIVFLYFVGYDMATIIFALLVLLVCYIVLDVLTFLVAYKFSFMEYRKELNKIWWVMFVLPVYRYLVYWYRVGGVIEVLTADKVWRTQNPFKQIKRYLSGDVE